MSRSKDPSEWTAADLIEAEQNGEELPEPWASLRRLTRPIICNPVSKQMVEDAHALERAGIDDPPKVPGVPLAETLHIAARVHLAPTEEWQAFRILRNRLMCNGLTLDEALARIKSMADEEMARHDARPADAAVSELADRYASEHDPYAGRPIVAAVLRRPRDWVADRIRQARVMRSRISLSRRKR